MMRPPLRKIAGGFLRDVESPGEIHPQHALKFFQGQFLDRSIANDPGVVHENVEPAESFGDRRHHRFDLVRLRHVAFDDERILQPARDVLRIGFVLPLGIADEIDDAVRATIAERFDHRRAEAARTAGHENDFASEIKRISHRRR